MINWFVSAEVAPSILSMRLFNVALFVFLTTAIAAVTTRDIRRLMAYTIVPILVPLGVFIIASINPSSWALTGLTAYFFAFHTFLSEGVRRRGVALALAIAGLLMALAARGDAAIFAIITTAALSVLNWRRLRRSKRQMAVPLALVALCGWRALDSAQIASIAGASPESDKPILIVLDSLLFNFPTLYSGVFGIGWSPLGWVDTPVPSVTSLSVLAVVSFLLFSGFGRMNRTKLVAAVVVAVPLFAIPAITLLRARLMVGESVQPRYFLPLMVVLLAVALAGAVKIPYTQVSRWQGGLMWILVSVAHAAALHENLRRYVVGTDRLLIPGVQEWWWESAPSPWLVLLSGSVAFAALALPLIAMSRRESDPAPSERHAESRAHVEATLNERVVDRDVHD